MAGLVFLPFRITAYDSSKKMSGPTIRVTKTTASALKFMNTGLSLQTN